MTDDDGKVRAPAALERGRPEAPAPHAEKGRPPIERLGLALVALLFGAMFGGVAVAAWLGGEVFLAAMGAIGCLMTVWVGLLTVVRG